MRLSGYWLSSQTESFGETVQSFGCGCLVIGCQVKQGVSEKLFKVLDEALWLLAVKSNIEKQIRVMDGAV